MKYYYAARIEEAFERKYYYAARIEGDGGATEIDGVQVVLAEDAKHDTIDPDRMARWEMASKLPYTLTKGVTATREGLCLEDRWDLAAVITVVYPWWFVAERLRYLPRLDAILCDDAEAFRMLHWCVNNLTALQEAGDA